MKYVFLGLSITSSWGNGHATTYRGLVRELVARGHDVLFLERDAPWYAANRDMPEPPFGHTALYDDFSTLELCHAGAVRDADVVVMGSYVPQGAMVGPWVTRTARGVRVFYDIDTPITLAGLERGGVDYLTRELVPQFDLYLSFTGGPTLQRLEREFGARAARALYCSVDPTLYYPESRELKWSLGYLGTYSQDRQPALEELLLAPARVSPRQRFIVAGPQYPSQLVWPDNVEREIHIAPCDHRRFYAAQRFTLNITRAEMVRAGFSPSVRLFEAAACGTPVISDAWPGLETLFVPGQEILLARSAKEVRSYLSDVSERERKAVAERARARICAEHTAAHRAAELDHYVSAIVRGQTPDHARTVLPLSAQHGAP